MKKLIFGLYMVVCVAFMVACSSNDNPSTKATDSSSTSTTSTTSSSTSTDSDTSQEPDSSTNTTTNFDPTPTDDTVGLIRALEEEKVEYEKLKKQLVAPALNIECTFCSDPDNLETCSRCDGKGSVIIGSNVVPCSCTVSSVPGKLSCPECGDKGTVSNPYYDSEYAIYKNELDELNQAISDIEAKIKQLGA